MSVYRVTEIIGTSEKSWEEAARTALSAAAGSLRELRIAEVVEQDVVIGENGAIELFRTKLRVSFKYDKA
ncbi:MAG: dodecin domain-containing protein [Alphaproteobacteria bacterium]|nr:dodecin domain-containing protein [Alphaproteobacteria bacterium]